MDAFAVLYRAHFGFAPTSRLRTNDGVDTSVMHGFVGILLALLETVPPPTHFAVVFDGGSGMTAGFKGATFRSRSLDYATPASIIHHDPFVSQLMRLESLNLSSQALIKSLRIIFVWLGACFSVLPGQMVNAQDLFFRVVG